MKKILSIVLCFILLMSVMPFGVIAATDTPTIVVDQVSGYAGDTVLVNIKLENNPGIISMRLEVNYDSDILELTGKANGAGFKGMAYSWYLTDNPYVVNWVDSINPNNKTDGTFATLSFKVKEGAAIGKSDITITYDPDDVFNSDWANVGFEVVSGAVTVVLCKEHVEKIVNAKDHTENEEGYTGDVVCSLCEEVIEEGEVIPAGHVFEEVAEEAATCTEDGVKAYYDCSICDAIADEDFNEVTTDDLIIKAAGHNFTEVVKGTVSCKQAGTVDYKTCVDCAQNFAADADIYSTTPLSTILSDMLPHNLVENNVCTMCGEIIYNDILSYKIAYNSAIITDCADNYVGELIIPETIDGYPVKIIRNYAFLWCSYITSVVIPDSVVEIGVGAFMECNALTSVTLPEGLKSIGYSTFERCELLTDINIPSTVKSIDNFAFCGCRSLKTIIIPDSIENIYNNVFENCTSLTNITIPNSVTFIDSNAFNGCDSILQINYNGTQNEWNNIQIMSGNYPLHLATIKFKDLYVTGDIGGDSVVNNRDLAVLMQYMNGWELENINPDAADVNRDGYVNNRDYAMLQQYLNGWDIELY